MSNSILLGDAIEELKNIDSKSIDCVVTSPPYWKGFAYEAYFNSYLQYMEWTKLWLKETKRVLKDDGTLWLNISNDSETTIRAFEVMNIATKDLMYKLHDTIVWYRFNQQPANTDRQLTNQCEYIFMLKHTSADIKLNKTDAYNNAPELFKTKNVGNVWELPFNSGKEKNNFGKKETKSNYGHSGFPVRLPETCILLSTNEGDTVLDMFGGTGTTAVAAKKLNRKYIIIEKEKEYIKIITERLEA